MNMVINMDCVLGMGMYPDNHFDSIVCDPPYELGFMGKAWDATGIANSVEMWREALRVLKPGGHLLAFSGSRTYHRMTCAIEDAGFEVRDQIMWVYGSGFPKSLDVSKAIDKAAGVVREAVGTSDSRGRDGANRQIVASKSDGYGFSQKGGLVETTPATDAARQWEGWGTALKPAHEPICVARKPLIGTVAANVLAHGTGALNIEGCQVGSEERPVMVRTGTVVAASSMSGVSTGATSSGETTSLGRWPANLIHDGSDEVLAAFPDAKGQQGATAERQQGALYGTVSAGEPGVEPRNDAASAARFFYCAKASKSDRGTGNVHPTVKPTDLMRYLCRLVTPPGGIILDPFAGSGSTGRAATLEGFRFIGFELSAEYADIANARLNVQST